MCLCVCVCTCADRRWAYHCIETGAIAQQQQQQQLKLLLLFISKVNFVLYHSSSRSSNESNKSWACLPTSQPASVWEMKVFSGNGSCTRCRVATAATAASDRANESGQLTLRRVNKVKQMKNQQAAHTSLPLPLPLPLPIALAGFSLATIALRQTIFLLSFAIHAGGPGGSMRLATLYFTAPFPWQRFFRPSSTLIYIYISIFFIVGAAKCSMHNF